MSDWKLWACSEYCGVMPDGRVKPADADESHWRIDAGGRIERPAPRNGWLSLRCVVEGRGEFTVRCEMDSGEIACDLFREFYHRMTGDEPLYLADALVPVENGAALAIPAADGDCPSQIAQSFWVDLFVDRDAKVGPHAGRLIVNAGGSELAIDLALDVLDVSYPDEDCIQFDHNSYGTRFIEAGYSEILPDEPGPERNAKLIEISQAYHRMCFEHHGLLHQLGYGHSGVTHHPIFAPALAGDGRNRHVSDWSIFDAHYGPLLDGSAFAGGKRKPLPVYSIYLPLNAAWPADYIGWGQRGYRAEFVNVVRDFDEHFRENGWTQTHLELLFNHKKRFGYFEWDGDEPRYARDDPYWRIYRGFIDEATAGSPCQWRFRCDASWMMARHWKDMVGVIDFWVCGGFSKWFEAELHEGPMARGEIIWTYGSPATIFEPSSAIIQTAYRTWIRDFTGDCHWLTVQYRGDMWTANDGAQTTLFYPGLRFGIEGPIPTIRLKIQRNAVQDLNLLETVAAARGKDGVKSDLIPTIPLELWRKKPPAVDELPPWEWTRANLSTGMDPTEDRIETLPPLWWQAVREYAQAKATEVSRG